MPAATASKTTTLANMSKPTYAVMVTESIKALGNRTASSVPAIKKQLGMQYKIEAAKINQKALTNAIKKGVQTGDFVQIKASYKLGKKATSVVKKTVVKKTTTTKTTITKKKPSSGKVKGVLKKKTTKTSSSKPKSMKPKKSIGKKSSGKSVKKGPTTKIVKKKTTSAKKQRPAASA